MAINNDNITINEYVEGFQQLPELARLNAYKPGEQLNALYDDIQAGLFGEAAKTGKFCSYVESVKAAYPKA
jgi:hypothetical protein